jgi:hypothetical protein
MIDEDGKPQVEVGRRQFEARRVSQRKGLPGNLFIGRKGRRTGNPRRRNQNETIWKLLGSKITL